MDAGENSKAVSEYAGHAEPALTLRVYAHLVPDRRERARRAIDTVFERAPGEDHGPQTAQQASDGPGSAIRCRSGAFSRS
ncbi:hypothetical protein MQP27_28385 [Streptomyces sp. 7R015]|uniref:Integrase n=1 Tax=Streptomyces cylindrosporus TaxID=2927583 RepID=A0ABS9YEH2_9ACTN|nr:hypothetical protein [Streptomyces cylindrosporus]